MSADSEALVQLRFETRVVYWRGPSPFFFAPTPPELVEDLKQVARVVTYGWGMIPVEADIGGVVFTTSLYPKDGGYLLPLKTDVRRKANITTDDVIVVEMTIQPPERAGQGGRRWGPV